MSQSIYNQGSTNSLLGGMVRQTPSNNHFHSWAFICSAFGEGKKHKQYLILFLISSTCKKEKIPFSQTQETKVDRGCPENRTYLCGLSQYFWTHSVLTDVRLSIWNSTNKILGCIAGLFSLVLCFQLWGCHTTGQFANRTAPSIW